jgi:hypothetical protein
VLAALVGLGGAVKDSPPLLSTLRMKANPAKVPVHDEG